MPDDAPPHARPDICRLCGGPTRRIFSKRILTRYDVDYHQCQRCGCQQTDRPFWLHEAYAIPVLNIDIGAPTRTIKNWLAATVLLDLLEIPLEARGLDFGAGHGMFTGLMRSVGRDFVSHDAFSRPIFSSYQVVGELGDATPDILTAFEVLEHLPDPAETLDDLFSRGAPLILFTTWMVDDQPEDWIYYLPDCGQHVFFYARKALEDLAARHGYQMRVSQYFFILFRPDLLNVHQIATIEDFSLRAPQRVEPRIADLILSVIGGNAFLDAELDRAMARFRRDLVAGHDPSVA